ncbi:SatD family protein [Pedobacter deserti]|uniref:SatD family protein n=1 Tax=Pedobacter deserti TaxID=2817382 RepID=UPI00210ECC3B|nr:SatD family protein [Pedobacter sp. SYSU D00382]
MKNHAVVTGDIIGFTKLSPQKRKALITHTENLLKSWIANAADAEIFRGDSYQMIFADLRYALTRSIQLVCWFKTYVADQDKTRMDTRISIGVGTISYQGKNVLNSDGEAFHLSGRRFDKMQEGEYLAISTGHEETDTTLEIMLNFINAYMASWTKGQAEVIYLILEGKTQQEISAALSLSQPSVNSRLKLAGWKEFEPAIRYIASLLEKKNGN